MKFNENYLQKLIEGKVQGDFFPYDSGNHEDTEQYIRKVAGRLKDIPTLALESDFNHYGSGYASYVPVYLWKKDGSGTIITENTPGVLWKDVECLLIYICRLSPYAVISTSEKRTLIEQGQEKANSVERIFPDTIGLLPTSDWFSELEQIRTILNSFGITILTKEELNLPLTFPASIPTMTGYPPYTIFDCFFYWED